MERVLLISGNGIVNIHQCRQVNNCIIHPCNPGALWLAGSPRSLPPVLWLNSLLFKFQVPVNALVCTMSLQDSFTFKSLADSLIKSDAHKCFILYSKKKGAFLCVQCEVKD